MRFIHTADLHLGKSLHEFSLLGEQEDFLCQLLALAQEHQVRAVLIAGDVFDKAVPPAGAVTVLDNFLTALAEADIACFIISGNHDSADRLAFGAKLMRARHIHLAQPFEGKLQSIRLSDEFGPLTIHLLPFIKPSQVRRYVDDEDTAAALDSYEAAVRFVLQQTPLNPQERHLLLAHQFVTDQGLAPQRSESETLTLGGLDNIDAALFGEFDYVALGHIHRPQAVGRAALRYAGAPLPYAFSEAKQHKSVTLVELKAKGELNIELLPIRPLHELRRFSGALDAVLQQGAQADHSDALVQVTLSDDVSLDARSRLRAVFPQLLELRYEREDGGELTALSSDMMESSTPLELFAAFFRGQTGHDMDEQQSALVCSLLDQLLNANGGEA